MLPFIREEKHRKGKSGCVRILDTKACQAQKAENTDSRMNSAVKYATARGHLTQDVLRNCLCVAVRLEKHLNATRQKLPRDKIRGPIAALTARFLSLLGRFPTLRGHYPHFLGTVSPLED